MWIHCPQIYKSTLQNATIQHKRRWWMGFRTTCYRKFILLHCWNISCVIHSLVIFRSQMGIRGKCPPIFLCPQFCCEQKNLLQIYKKHKNLVPLKVNFSPQILKPGYEQALIQSTYIFKLWLYNNQTTFSFRSQQHGRINDRSNTVG